MGISTRCERLVWLARSTRPFAPQELLRWATAWIGEIRGMHPKERAEFLHCKLWMGTRLVNDELRIVESTEECESWLITDLEGAAAFAKQAIHDGVRLRMGLEA